MRTDRSRHLMDPIKLLLAVAMLGGCARLADEPSPSTEQQISVAPDQTASPVAPSTPDPTMAPTAETPSARPSPNVADLAPVAGTELPIAARDGAPGVMTCSGLGPYTFETLRARPAGAEALPGPEYDVLRETIARYGTDPEFAFDGVTFREANRDATRVSFLGDLGHPEGPFATITARFDGSAWKWAGMDGGCPLIGEPGPGWGAANWVFDPAFKAPKSTTRKLHLLVREQLCDAPESIIGRLGPAFVFYEPKRLRIQLTVLAPKHATSCEGRDPTGSGPPTAVSLTLPEPLGSRDPEDAIPKPCPGCGG